LHYAETAAKKKTDDEAAAKKKADAEARPAINYNSFKILN